MPDDERPEAAVISLDEARVELEGQPITRERSYCYHRYVTINMNRRALTCRKCAALVDPYAYIEYLGTQWDKYAVALAYMRSETKRLEAKLEETKRQERNARARLKRIQGKLGDKE